MYWNLPYTPIRDAVAGGVVRVGGRAELVGTLVTAPLTGRECAAFEVNVEEFWAAGGQWMPILREARAVDFVLRDATGKAFVAVRGGHLALTPDTRFSSGWSGFPPRVAELLQRHGQSLYGPMGVRSLRCVEAVLLGKARISVIGSAEREPDPDGSASDEPSGYRAPPQRLVLRSSAAGPLLVSHDPMLP